MSGRERGSGEGEGGVRGADRASGDAPDTVEELRRRLEEAERKAAAAERTARMREHAVAHWTARYHDIFRQLELATRPSAPRRIGRELRRVVRGYRCELRPERGGIAREPSDVAFGRLRLIPVQGRLPAGWISLDAEIEPVGGEPIVPVLYADDGSGIVEECPTAFPESRAGRATGIMKLPDRVTDLYLDLGIDPADARVGAIRVREFSRVEAAASGIAPLVADDLRHPDRALAALRSGWRVLRDEGWAALKRRFRDATYAEPRVIDYDTWVTRNDVLRPADRSAIERRSAKLAQAAGITVVLLADPGATSDDVEATLRSCDQQLFGRWSGVVCNLSGARASVAIDRALAGRDRWRSPPVSSPEALAAAIDEDLVVFVRPGDVLAPHALYAFVEAMAREPGAEAAYCDRDRLVEGSRTAPSLLPDWSPYRLWSHDYVGHAVACRASFLRRALPERLGGALVYELLLAAARAGAAVQHLPFVLYHCRQPVAVEEDARRAALERHLRRVAPGACVEPGKLAGTSRVRPPMPPERPLASILIPTRNRVELLRRCIDTLRGETRYDPYEILVIDNGSDDPQALRYLAELESSGAARVLRYPGRFNFASINDHGARAARGSVLVLLNNDIEIHDPGWLEELVAWALRDDVGAVGCRLRYGDGRVQHDGVLLGVGGLAVHQHRFRDPDDPASDPDARVVREVGALTAACLALREQVWNEVGGMDEELPIAFNDVDLCIRIRERGYRLLFTPNADLLHLESASRGAERTIEEQARLAAEARYVLERHGALARIDPYYSPNLSLEREGELAARPRVRKAWRDVDRARITFLTYRLMKGFGVDVVVAEQAEYFAARGWLVLMIVLEKDDHYDVRFGDDVAAGRIRIVRVASPEEADARVTSFGPDVVIAHTPPFYELLPRVADRAVTIAFDHGEPPAELFVDAERRRVIAGRKADIARSVDAAVAISEFVRTESGLAEAVVCRNGNDHLLRRRSNLRALVGTFRRRHGLERAFVVLNITRYLHDERRYKGIGEYAAVRDELVRARPDLADRVRFVIAGRSEPEDRAWAEERGLVALSNVADDELVAAYLDADAYVSTSQWEGYNLGIGQALALGVPTFASARGAHPEFSIPTSNDPRHLAAWIAERADASDAPATPIRRLRHAAVAPWRDAAARVEMLAADRVRRRTGRNANVPEPLAGRSEPHPEVSFLVLNKDRLDLLAPCIRSIEERCDVAYEILVGDTGSTDPAVLRFYETTPHAVHYLGFYQFSACNNVLAARARGRVLVFLNNDTELIETRFGDALAYLREHADVGCVGGYLVYPNGCIQHAGVRICPEAPYRGIPEHFDKHMPIEGYPARRAPRDVVAVTGAMLLIPAERFRAAGGFDEVYEEEAQDIDLCLRLRREGLRSVIHPALLAYHHENATRTVKEAPADRAEFLRRFGGEIEREIYAWQRQAGLA
jgi:GT2 family glycosyltransferase